MGPLNKTRIRFTLAHHSDQNEGSLMDVWIWRVVGIVLLGFSVLGFLNGLVLRIHGPAFDLGIVAGVLAAAAFYAAHKMRER